MVRFFQLGVTNEGFAVLAPILGLEKIYSVCLTKKKGINVTVTDRRFPVFRHRLRWCNVIDGFDSAACCRGMSTRILTFDDKPSLNADDHSNLTHNSASPQPCHRNWSTSL